MDDTIVDCCSLLNLYAGWGDLKELHHFPSVWYVCQTALVESEFTREFDADGNIVDVPLDLRVPIREGLLRTVSPKSGSESADYVAFATEVDDGEAQALAIAKHRGYRLLTDDRKASRIAARPEVIVTTLSTAALLRMWAHNTGAQEQVLHQIIRRIMQLARYAPPKDCEDREWWEQFT